MDPPASRPKAEFDTVPMPVGPIGILSFRNSPIRHLAPLRVRALLAESALQEVDLRFFAAAECDPAAGLVRASRWVRGGWEESTIDLPGLVLYADHPATPRHRDVDHWIRSRARVVGFRGRDKLDVSAMMLQSPWAAHVIPSERLDPLTVDEQLASWLAGGGIVVKPSDGMRGLGIRFVVPVAVGWAVFHGEKCWKGSADESLARVARGIRARMRYRDYLIQRYIDSRNEAGRPVAIRVDIVRRPDGGWGLVRMAGRIAGIGRLTSNGARGGAYMAIEPFLAARRIRPAKEIADEAFALACGVGDMLVSQPSRTIYYETGIDLVLDANDQVWFIEANSRPQAIGAQHERAMLVIAYLKSLAAEPPSYRDQPPHKTP